MERFIISFCAITLLIGIGFILYTRDPGSISNSPEIPSAQQAALFQGLSEETIRDEVDENQLFNEFPVIEPIEEFSNRITKKHFGMYITPETSPVQPDRFSGYHTGVDVEYEDTIEDVPVMAIADGTIVVNKVASGYGGVLVIRHTIDGENILALYGHLDPQSLPPDDVKEIKQGQILGVLGEGGTSETDGARKHLHFSLLKKERVDLRGYVQSQHELTDWYNPLDFFSL